MWHDLPDLNHKRHLHASLVHKNRLFVMGGDNGATFVASVEFIDLGGVAAVWTILTQGSNLLKRAIPAATVVNQDEIAVFGGLSKGGTKSDGYVVDSNSESIEPALEGDAGFAFRTYNQAQRAGERRFVTLGKSADDQLHVVEFDYKEPKSALCRPIHKLGHCRKSDEQLQEENRRVYRRQVSEVTGALEMRCCSSDLSDSNSEDSDM